jgi:ABC-2 type transport system ATP-binding protein
MINLISIQKLKFWYDNNVVFDGANLEVKSNAITGIIGPNGCGKSTLFNLIMGNSQFQAIQLTDKFHRDQIILMSQEFVMPSLLTIEEAMVLILNLNNTKVASTKDLVSLWSTKEQKRFQNIRSKRCSQCSVGERKWVYLRIVLSLDKQLYILDEPTAGVDPEYRLTIWTLLSEEIKKGKSFLVSSHLLDEIADNCNSINFINNRIIDYYPSKELLMEKYKSRNLDEAFLAALA